MQSLLCEIKKANRLRVLGWEGLVKGWLKVRDDFEGGNLQPFVVVVLFRARARARVCVSPCIVNTPVPFPASPFHHIKYITL